MENEDASFQIGDRVWWHNILNKSKCIVVPPPDNWVWIQTEDNDGAPWPVRIDSVEPRR